MIFHQPLISTAVQGVWRSVSSGGLPERNAGFAGGTTARHRL